METKNLKSLNEHRARDIATINTLLQLRATLQRLPEDGLEKATSTN